MYRITYDICFTGIKLCDITTVNIDTEMQWKQFNIATHLLDRMRVISPKWDATR